MDVGGGRHQKYGISVSEGLVPANRLIIFGQYHVSVMLLSCLGVKLWRATMQR